MVLKPDGAFNVQSREVCFMNHNYTIILDCYAITLNDKIECIPLANRLVSIFAGKRCCSVLSR